MDHGKSFEAAKKSIMAMVGLNLVAVILAMVPALSFFGGMLSMLTFFIINPILLGYAGFMAVKKMKLDLGHGAVAGVLAGVVAGAINMVIGLVFAVLGLGTAAATAQTSLGAGSEAAAGGILLVAAVIAGVISVVILAVMGAVCGAIGAVVAKSK